jgi:hypothetical protein
MERIGRRISFAFSPETTIVLTKFLKNIHKLGAKEGLIEEVFEFDGELIYRTVGSTPKCTHGRDVNDLVTNNECWFTEEEYAEILTDKFKEDE